MDDLTKALSHQPFMRDMDPAHLTILASFVKTATFEPRELIVREGDPATCFYLIEDGKVAIEIFSPQRGPVTVDTIQDGEVLGWSWLVSPFKWIFDAQVLEPTRAFVFEADDVRNACRSDTGFGYALLQRFVPIIVERLQATRVQLLDLYHVETR